MFVEAQHIILKCSRCKKTLEAIKACKANGDCVYLDPNSSYLSRMAYCNKCELPCVADHSMKGGNYVQSRS